MKIKKQGNFLVAFKEESDNVLPNMNKAISVGESLGKISLRTGKFVGNTVSLIPLNDEYDRIKTASKTPLPYGRMKAHALKTFDELLDNARELLISISFNNLIELQAEGVTFSMIDPFSDSELSDVISIKDGNIVLENGSEVSVNDVTNVNDLIGLLGVIDE